MTTDEAQAGFLSSLDRFEAYLAGLVGVGVGDGGGPGRGTEQDAGEGKGET